VPFSLSVSKVQRVGTAVDIKTGSSWWIFFYGNILLWCVWACNKILTPVVNKKPWSYCSRAPVRSIWTRPSVYEDYTRLKYIKYKYNKNIFYFFTHNRYQYSNIIMFVLISRVTTKNDVLVKRFRPTSWRAMIVMLSTHYNIGVRIYLNILRVYGYRRIDLR